MQNKKEYDKLWRQEHPDYHKEYMKGYYNYRI